MIKINSENNQKLKNIMKVVNSDKELETTWKCSNINAIDRLGMSDHGPIHMKIVTNFALKTLRLLLKSNVTPSSVAYHSLDKDDSEVIVVLAALMHDLGISIHRDVHEEYSLFLAGRFLDKILPEVYEDDETRTIIKSEVLHAIVAHSRDIIPYTLEGGIVRLADALDMEKGRARIPFNIGKVNIHSVSALAIESVSIEEGKRRPVDVKIDMSNSAGIFQIDELLKGKLENNPLKEHVSIIVETGDSEKKIIDRFEFGWDD